MLAVVPSWASWEDNGQAETLSPQFWAAWQGGFKRPAVSQAQLRRRGAGEADRRYFTQAGRENGFAVKSVKTLN